MSVGRAFRPAAPPPAARPRGAALAVWHLARGRRRAAGKWALDVARFGIVARALVLVVLASGVVRAALVHRASEAGGMGASLVILNSLPTGGLLLGATAAGLLAYGL